MRNNKKAVSSTMLLVIIGLLLAAMALVVMFAGNQRIMSFLLQMILPEEKPDVTDIASFTNFDRLNDEIKWLIEEGDRSGVGYISKDIPYTLGGDYTNRYTNKVDIDWYWLIGFNADEDANQCIFDSTGGLNEVEITEVPEKCDGRACLCFCTENGGCLAENCVLYKDIDYFISNDDMTLQVGESLSGVIDPLSDEEPNCLVFRGGNALINKWVSRDIHVEIIYRAKTYAYISQIDSDTEDREYESTSYATLGPWLTGPESPNSETIIKGTDLGISFIHEGRLYYLFGDTNITGAGPARDYSNLIAIDEGDGLFNVIGPILTRDDSKEYTLIPTGGVSVNNRIYVTLMSIEEWLEHGEWETNGAVLAYSDDDGASFTRIDDYFPEDSNFVQSYLVEEGDYVYFFGIPEGRFGGAKLARVAKGAMLDNTKIMYYEPVSEKWVAEEDGAGIIVEEPVGELSVQELITGDWIMTYLDDRKDVIVMRTSSNLMNWDGGASILDCNKAEYQGCYAPMLMPISSNRDIRFTISFWGDYNVRTGNIVLG